MALPTEEIKKHLEARFGTLEKAARHLSNEEYEFSASSLSKVINFKRETKIIQTRVAKAIDSDIETVFGNHPAPQPETPAQSWSYFGS